MTFSSNERCLYIVYIEIYRHNEKVHKTIDHAVHAEKEAVVSFIKTSILFFAKSTPRGGKENVFLS